MSNEFKKFSKMTESVESQSEIQPITLDRCREEIIRLLSEDGHDTETSLEEIDAFAHQLMREFNWTFGLLERRIFGWKRNNPK